MKSSHSKTPLKLSIWILLLIIIQSCAKNEDPANTNCLGWIIEDTLKFKIIDKSTNQDLFFSENPVYTINEVKLLEKTSLNKMDTIIPKVGSLNGNKYFYLHLLTGPQGGTIYLKVADNALDTLFYETVKDPSEQCPKYNLSTLTYNDSVIGYDIHNKIVLIKK